MDVRASATRDLAEHARKGAEPAQRSSAMRVRPRKPRRAKPIRFLLNQSGGIPS